MTEIGMDGELKPSSSATAVDEVGCENGTQVTLYDECARLLAPVGDQKKSWGESSDENGEPAKVSAAANETSVVGGADGIWFGPSSVGDADTSRSHNLIEDVPLELASVEIQNENSIGSTPANDEAPMGNSASKKISEAAEQGRSWIFRSPVAEDEDAMAAEDVNDDEDSETPSGSGRQYSFAGILSRTSDRANEADDQAKEAEEAVVEQTPRQGRNAAGPSQPRKSSSASRNMNKVSSFFGASASPRAASYHRTQSLPDLSASDQTRAEDTSNAAELDFRAIRDTRQTRSPKSPSRRMLSPIFQGNLPEREMAVGSPQSSPPSTPPNPITPSVSTRSVSNSNEDEDDSFPFKPERTPTQRPKRRVTIKQNPTPSREVPRRPRNLAKEFESQEDSTARPFQRGSTEIVGRAPSGISVENLDGVAQRSSTESIGRPSPAKPGESARRTPQKPREAVTSTPKRRPEDGNGETPRRASSRTPDLRGNPRATPSRAAAEAAKGSPRAQSRPSATTPVRTPGRQQAISPAGTPGGPSKVKTPVKPFQGSSDEPQPGPSHEGLLRSPRRSSRMSKRLRTSPSLEREHLAHLPASSTEDSEPRHPRRVTFQNPEVSQIIETPAKRPRSRTDLTKGSDRRKKPRTQICGVCAGSIRRRTKDKKCTRCAVPLCNYCSCTCGSRNDGSSSRAKRLRQRLQQVSMTGSKRGDPNQDFLRERSCRRCSRFLYADSNATRCQRCSKPLCQQCQCACGGTTSKRTSNRSGASSRKNNLSGKRRN